MHTPSSKSKWRLLSDLKVVGKYTTIAWVFSRMWPEDTTTLQKINKYLVDIMVKINSLFIDNKMEISWTYSRGDKLWLYVVYRTVSTCSIIY